MIDEIREFIGKDNLFTLEKLDSTNGYQPHVKVGDTARGYAVVWPVDIDDQTRFVLAVGQSMISDSAIVTSIVQELVDKTDTSLTFKTLNSLYRLNKVDNLVQ